jgi:hypothetical protein
VVEPTVVLSIAPPVTATELAFCVDSVPTAEDSSFELFKLLKLASTSLFVSGLPLPARVTIVDIAYL